MIDIVKDHLQEIESLCRKYQVKRLELFGSAARGDFNPATSDLDFFVEFLSYDTPRIVDQWFGLQEDLERIFQRKVDLTSLRTVTNPHFIEVAQRQKVTLYAA
jgi:uncharacterized protein